MLRSLRNSIVQPDPNTAPEPVRGGSWRIAALVVSLGTLVCCGALVVLLGMGS